MVSISAHAIGTSDIQLNSKLGEPLDASLTLTDAEELNADQLIISHAPKEIYQKLGIKNSFQLQRLKFERNGNSVKISTRESIKEPYLNFILMFRWPEGELVREFKLLIDPS